jgi:hypothetical protein
VLANAKPIASRGVWKSDYRHGLSPRPLSHAPVAPWRQRRLNGWGGRAEGARRRTGKLARPTNGLLIACFHRGAGHVSRASERSRPPPTRQAEQFDRRPVKPDGMAVQGPKHPRRRTFSNPGNHPSCGNRCSLNPPNRRIRTRMSGGVGGGGREADPYPDQASNRDRGAKSRNGDCARYQEWLCWAIFLIIDDRITKLGGKG